MPAPWLACSVSAPHPGLLLCKMGMLMRQWCGAMRSECRKLGQEPDTYWWWRWSRWRWSSWLPLQGVRKDQSEAKRTRYVSKSTRFLGNGTPAPHHLHVGPWIVLVSVLENDANDNSVQSGSGGLWDGGSLGAWPTVYALHIPLCLSSHSLLWRPLWPSVPDCSAKNCFPSVLAKHTRPWPWLSGLDCLGQIEPLIITRRTFGLSCVLPPPLYHQENSCSWFKIQLKLLAFSYVLLNASLYLCAPRIPDSVHFIQMTGCFSGSCLGTKPKTYFSSTIKS